MRRESGREPGFVERYGRRSRRYWPACCALLLLTAAAGNRAAAANGDADIQWISAFAPTTLEEGQRALEQIEAHMKTHRDRPDLHLKRGAIYLGMHAFAEAVADFGSAIELGDLDAAYFGRGLALGRMQRFEQAIADLSVYIKRNPDSSLAYTKRGIRRLWSGDRGGAKSDFLKAVALNPRNAEAHDDLGVVLAQDNEHRKAISHFMETIRIDPSYYKAYHNLALTHYLLGEDGQALAYIESALSQRPNDKNSVLLKAEILRSLGRMRESKALQEEAEFMDEGNWSEQIAVE